MLYKGKSIITGKEIVGYLILCEGLVNPGCAYICREVSSIEGSGQAGDENQLMIGPFIQVAPSTVEAVHQNTVFSFLYRDASNYKTHNEYVLKGVLSKEEIDEIVSCGDGDNFICEQVGLFHSFPGDGDVTEDDHAWCEFYYEDDHGFSRTDKEPTVTMTARELLDSFRKAKGNWNEATYLPENIY